jgi:hypothetical protein
MISPRQATAMAHFGVTPATYQDGDEQFASAEYHRTLTREMATGGVGATGGVEGRRVRR